MQNLISSLQARTPLVWRNPKCRPLAQAVCGLALGKNELTAARASWSRFAPLLAHLFPELQATEGIIDSPLLPLAELGAQLELPPQALWMKADHALPVAGSIKARGGLFAVLRVAERLALKQGIIADTDDNYVRFADEKARQFFASQTLTVGSTGNLGYSIGVIGAKLGFKVKVHMSQEAQEWKKERLRQHGVTVAEHATDYTKACVVARAEAAADTNTHFIDDENSLDLFMGYSSAIFRLQQQLTAAGVVVDDAHPLYLYLPCGVGGAPGGITWAARLVFGDNAHAYFVEPVEAPCCLAGLSTGDHAECNVNDFGIYLKTIADGLAVAQPSRFVGKLMESLLEGCITVTDGELLHYLAQLYEVAEIEVEPSAASGLPALRRLLNTATAAERTTLDAATHVVWSTGGSHVPAAQHRKYREMAAKTA